MADAQKNKTGMNMMPRRGSGHNDRFSREKPKVKDSKKTLLRFGSYMTKYKFRLIIVFILVLISSLKEMLTPWLISIAIDQYIIPGDMAGLLKIVILMGGIILVTAGAGWLQQYLMIGATQKILGNFRQDLFTHLQKLDLKYYDSRPRGELMSRFTNDIENISNVMNQVVTQFLASIFSLVGVVVMMFLLNPILAGITLATVPLIFIITKLIGKSTRESFKQQQVLLGKINGQIEETITGMKVVKLFNREEQIASELEETNDRLKKTTIRAQVMAGMMGPLMNLTNNIRFAVVAGAGGLLGIHKFATVGTIAAFLNYTRQFGRPLNEIAQLYNSILSAMAGAERVFEVLDTPPRIVSEPGAIALSQVKGEVVFRNVSFGYNEDVPVLKDINFIARPGETVAFVGPTGAGKTTIINLLTRFYDIPAGEISLDGLDIRRYSLESLRKNLGLVLQDTFLFSGSVMDNLRYGNLEASDEEVYAAARASRADHFIRHLPDGYNTILSEEGQNLSQGQRQLIAIARAILADPSVLILDEATSNVDTRTEQLIQEGMLQLMKGRTSFIIAHRLSTIRSADKIIVLKDGEIIEQGRHKELLDRKGFYARLHSAHFETEIL